MSRQKIFVPSSGPGDWRGLLADPEKHWARRKSARTLAHCWEDVGGLPSEVGSILNTAMTLSDIQPLLIFPEWKVPLPGGHRDSQNDVWVLAKCSNGLVSIAVEGKVDESFNEPLWKWLADASPGKMERLEYIKSVLGLKARIPDTVYYQLLHRTASAVIEADRFGANQAVMLVHSFSPENKGFPEFEAFGKLYGLTPEIGTLCTTHAGNGMPLHLGWVRGDERYLET